MLFLRKHTTFLQEKQLFPVSKLGVLIIRTLLFRAQARIALVNLGPSGGLSAWDSLGMKGFIQGSGQILERNANYGFRVYGVLIQGSSM